MRLRESPPWLAEMPKPFGALILACAMVRAEAGVWTENGVALEAHIVGRDKTIRLSPAQRADLLRALIAGQVRREPEDAPALIEHVVAEELRLIQELRQPSEVERSAGIRHAVFPILAAIVG